MAQSKEEEWERRALDLVGRHWRWIVVLAWLSFCAWFIFSKWTAIRWFGLPDTDDNMRIMQVRALLHGQGWYDLRQYRLNPPFGANIHWSRLVDLPIAGLILGLRPFLGGAAAERWAVAIAPLLPYLLLLFSLALTARRLLGPTAYPLAIMTLCLAGSTNGMFMPERIDHHGWQLALLARSIAGLADPKRIRGGLTLGISTSLSLAIGLEMLIYLAIAGVATVLFWVEDRDERDRLVAYALSLGGGTALAFLIFASSDNWFAVCDALSPVWLSDALIGSALMFALAWLSPADWRKRLALALAAGLTVAGFHALVWPDCLQRLERLPPEAERLWMAHVKEARPVYRHGWRIATLIVALPVTGAIGWGLLIWNRRRDPDARRRAIAAALPGIVAGLLLLWQTRTGPAAQMMGIVGCAALIWFLLPPIWYGRSSALRVVGGSLLFIVGTSTAVPFVLSLIPETNGGARGGQIGRANALCASLWGLKPVALQPKGMVFTFIDLGPRLITVTHHDAVGGPYHRNAQQIIDVMNAWRGSADQAHRIIAKYHSDYVLSCPNSSTTTIFMAETPKGFYGQLQRGQVPDWLKPVPLPKDSPYRMWKVVG